MGARFTCLVESFPQHLQLPFPRDDLARPLRNGDGKESMHMVRTCSGNGTRLFRTGHFQNARSLKQTRKCSGIKA